MFSDLKKCICLLLPVAVLTLPACSDSKKDTTTSAAPEPEISAEQTVSEETSSELTSEETTGTETTTEEETTEPIELDTDSADSICKKHGAVGVQAAVIRDGKVVATYEYGTAVKPDTKVNSETKYRVASLSKLVTACVFMSLVDEGLADEKTDIGEYLGYKVRNPSYPDTAITAEMLMSHTSSIIDSSAFLESRLSHSSTSLETLLGYSSSYSGYKPGSNDSYSNFGVSVIGAICEKITGEHFEDLAKKYVFEPMGIDAAYTASNLKDTSLLGELYGYGGCSISEQLNESFCEELGQTHHLVQGNLTISAKDYAKILCTVMNGGKTSDGKQILSKSSADSILAKHNTEGRDIYGYGLYFCDSVIKGKSMAIHTGSNFGMFSAFAICPDEKNGVVILTSGADNGSDSTTEIYNICLELIRLFYE